ncbi:MAG: putative Zn finger-like uncharacterized protein [Arenicella sp.]|jgi:predicted Zn finger-like uncharacterized protein
MALHNTQCPHCFTTYVISDEQLRVSEGMVRCGTCRERFQARILNAETETPRFDPREAFIEPLTEELVEQQQRSEAIAEAQAEPQEFTFADPHTESEKNISLSDATVSASLNSEMSLDIDHDAPVTSVHSSQLSATEMLANIRAKHALIEELREIEKSTANADNDAGDTATSDVNQKTGQHELALPINQPSIIQPRNRVDAPSESSADEDRTSSKELLIDQVDTLVNNKLVSTSSIKATTKKSNLNTDDIADDRFQLDRKPKLKSRAWLLAPPLLVIIMAFSGALFYQLWMKQIIVFKDGSLAQKRIAELRVPLAKKLALHNVVLPPRRNLSQLELASALTEAHPTRSSTTLLRIGIINHAEIEQPLPWLEMSLTDSEGKLVSRRKLSPEDYVYQNATNNLIGARELKKVTIELLSFPKQATGYEVKILNK